MAEYVAQLIEALEVCYRDNVNYEMDISFSECTPEVMRLLNDHFSGRATIHYEYCDVEWDPEEGFQLCRGHDAHLYLTRSDTS